MEIAKILAFIIFILCYAFAITRKWKIAYIGITSGIAISLILLFSNLASPKEIVDAIKWDVLGIYWGFMMLSMIFADSGIPKYLAFHLLRKTDSEGSALIILCAITAFLSAFLENVGVVLLMAPILIEIARKTGTPLFYYLVPVAISSNMSTTVTMVADPPSIILAAETGMKFWDFYLFQGKISIGVISIAGVLAGLLALYFVIGKRLRKKTHLEEEEIQINPLPAFILAFGVVLLIIGQKIGIPSGVAGLAVGSISLAVAHKKSVTMMKEFDWNSFFFVVGVFLVINGVDKIGLLKDFADGISRVSAGSPTLLLAMITWMSVAISSFMDNVPYTVLMIPVCKHLAEVTGVSPFPFLFGMLIGTGVGGNITPVGATANVFAVGILEKHGHRIKLREYLKISVPTTIASVLVGHLLLHLIWM
ncbi:MAG: SLC13 family permease [Candidatus Hadarchaeales archaeon]